MDLIGEVVPNIPIVSFVELVLGEGEVVLFDFHFFFLDWFRHAHRLGLWLLWLWWCRHSRDVLGDGHKDIFSIWEECFNKQGVVGKRT